MRRTFSKYGLIVSSLTFLTSLLLWVGSYFTNSKTDHLQFDTSGQIQDALHVLLRQGELWMFDQFKVDASGAVQPLDIVNPRLHVGPPIRRIGHVALPGFELHYAQFAPDGYIEWSLRVSLWLSSILSLLSVAGFFVRVRQLRKRAAVQAEPSDQRPEGRTDDLRQIKPQ